MYWQSFLLAALLDAKTWNIDQVCEWLEEISFGQYSDQFKAHEIRGQELIALQKSDLMVCAHTSCTCVLCKNVVDFAVVVARGQSECS